MDTAHLPCHSASQFTWEGNFGHCDASDLGINSSCRCRDHFARHIQHNGRTFEAFNVLSPKTGRIVLFIQSHVARDNEGEVVATTWLSDEGDFVLTVYND